MSDKIKKKITVSEAAEIIQQKAENWMDNNDNHVSIYVHTVRAAKKLSKNSIFNAAAWMKYSFGPCLHGEEDSDWIQSAKDLNKIFD